MARNCQQCRGEAFGVAARLGWRVAGEHRRPVQGPVVVAQHIGLDPGCAGSVRDPAGEVGFGGEQGGVAVGLGAVRDRERLQPGDVAGHSGQLAEDETPPGETG
ncbi:MAG: hypothetical protein ACRDRE_24975 [Pseudonocardiaceae bacterium]